MFTLLELLLFYVLRSRLHGLLLGFVGLCVPNTEIEVLSRNLVLQLRKLNFDLDCVDQSRPHDKFYHAPCVPSLQANEDGLCCEKEYGKGDYAFGLHSGY